MNPEQVALIDAETEVSKSTVRLHAALDSLENSLDQGSILKDVSGQLEAYLTETILANEKLLHDSCEKLLLDIQKKTLHNLQDLLNISESPQGIKLSSAFALGALVTLLFTPSRTRRTRK